MEGKPLEILCSMHRVGKQTEDTALIWALMVSLLSIVVLWFWSGSGGVGGGLSSESHQESSHREVLVAKLNASVFAVLGVRQLLHIQ